MEIPISAKTVFILRQRPDGQLAEAAVMSDQWDNKQWQVILTLCCCIQCFGESFDPSLHFISFFNHLSVNSISVLRCPWQPACCCLVLLTSVAMESSGVILAMVAWSVRDSSFYRRSDLLKFQEQILDIIMNSNEHSDVSNNQQLNYWFNSLLRLT